MQGYQKQNGSVYSKTITDSLRNYPWPAGCIAGLLAKIQLLDIEDKDFHFFGGCMVRVAFSFLGAISLLGSGPFPPALKAAMGDQVLMFPSPGKPFYFKNPQSDEFMLRSSPSQGP